MDITSCTISQSTTGDFLHEFIWHAITIHPLNGLFFQDNLGKMAPEEMMGWQWHQLDHMQIICTSLQTDNRTSTSSLSSYRPDALPDAQPIASKH